MPRFSAATSDDYALHDHLGVFDIVESLPASISRPLATLTMKSV